MQFKHREWLELTATVFMQRIRAGNERTREMLACSRDQVEKSKELLRAQVPKVWPRQPP